MSIIYNSTELENTTYNAEFVKHESTPERELNIIPYIKQTGGILVNQRFPYKTIPLRGYIVGSSQSDLDGKIDTLKKLFNTSEKNLDVSWAGGTRRYVATPRNFMCDRNHYNVSSVNFSVDFVIPSGVGKATSVISTISSLNITATPYTNTAVDFSSGSSKIFPYKIQLAKQSGTIRGFKFQNTKTGDYFIVTRSAGISTVEINSQDKSVTGTYDNFIGDFVSFEPTASEDIQIDVGEILDEKFDENYSTNWTVYNDGADDIRRAVSFKLKHTDNTYRKFAFYCNEIGTATGDLDWRVETDSNGEPSGTLVHAQAFGEILTGDVTSSLAWVEDTTNDIFSGLEANTTYWLVFQASASGGDVSNCYSLGAGTGYSKGSGKVSVDGGSTWTDQASSIWFRTYLGGLTPVSIDYDLTIEYYPTYL